MCEKEEEDVCKDAGFDSCAQKKEQEDTCKGVNDPYSTGNYKSCADMKTKEDSCKGVNDPYSTGNYKSCADMKTKEDSCKQLNNKDGQNISSCADKYNDDKNRSEMDAFDDSIDDNTTVQISNEESVNVDFSLKNFNREDDNYKIDYELDSELDGLDIILKKYTDFGYIDMIDTQVNIVENQTTEFRLEIIDKNFKDRSIGDIMRVITIKYESINYESSNSKNISIIISKSKVQSQQQQEVVDQQQSQQQGSPVDKQQSQQQQEVVDKQQSQQQVVDQKQVVDQQQPQSQQEVIDEEDIKNRLKFFLFSDMGIDIITVDGLVDDTDSQLIHLDLSSKGINDDNIDNIVKLLEYNSSIKSLVLSDNDLTDIGIGKLMEGLKNNKNIVSLHLNNIVLNDKSVEQISNMLSDNNTLQLLSLKNTNLNNDKLLKIKKSLQSNDKLQFLMIDDNVNIDNEGISTLNDIDSQNKNLKIYGTPEKVDLQLEQQEQEQVGSPLEQPQQVVEVINNLPIIIGGSVGGLLLILIIYFVYKRYKSR